MPPTDRKDRAALLAALALAIAAPACSVEATGALVTLDLKGLVPHTVVVTVRRGVTPIGARSYTGDPIPDGATFGVQLSDALDGVGIDIDVAALDGGRTVLGTGTGHVTIARRSVVRVTVPLAGQTMGHDGGSLDGGDMRTFDGPPADLAGDGAAPDLAVGDAADGGTDGGIDGGADGGDGGGVDGGNDMCVRSCNGGIAITCGSPATVACTCDANHLGCAIPTCQTPTDISAGGTFKTDTTSGTDQLSSSCGGKGAPEAVFSLTLTQFSTVTLDVNATSAPVLYSRQSCGGGTELIANGPCNQMPAVQACSIAMQNPRQVLCGLPPGTYYAIVDGSGNKGFPFSLTAATSPVSLDDCPGAGMLPGSVNTVTGNTANKNGSHMQAPANKPGCGVDQGSTAPEYVFYVPASNALPNGHLVARLSNVQNGFVPLLYIQQLCSPMTTVCALGTQQNAYAPSLDITPVMQGPYFIIVDGDQGTRGSFTLDVTWQ